MSESTDHIRGNLDLRVGARLVLCACELRERLDNLFNFGDIGEDLSTWEPGEDVDTDMLVQEVVESAMNIREQIENMNREGLA